MAFDDEQDTSRDDDIETDADNHVSRVAAKYTAEDDRRRAPDDEQDEDDSDDDSEHSGSETDSDAPDGDEESSDDESEEDDGEDTGEADDDAESETEDDDDAGEEEEDPGEEEPGPSRETRAALERHGARLTIEDVPEKYRPILQQKLSHLDKAFTRAMQEARAYRAEEAKARAEERFRAENPDLVILEMLRKDPAIFEKVNRRLKKLDPEEDGNDETSIADYASALHANIAEKRRTAHEAIKAEVDEYNRRLGRADQIEEHARTAAQKAGVPFGKALDAMLAAALMSKPEQGRDLSDEEINAIVADFASDYQVTVRKQRRAESRQAVVDRTKRRETARPAVRPPKSAASAGTSRRRQEEVDYDDEESRHRAMMRTAKRLFPGARDR